MAWDDIRTSQPWEWQGLSCCERTNKAMFTDWVKTIGATKYRKGVGETEDVPYLLKHGKSIAGYPNTIPNPGRNSREEYGFDIHDLFDHAHFYKNTKTGRCWVVSHIYDDSPEYRRRFAKWCAENDLVISYLSTSWYNPGQTTAVVITTIRR